LRAKRQPLGAKARVVRDAAKAEPEKFGKLQADMDRTGRVDGPFKRLKVMRQSEAIRKEPPSLPQQGPYRVIVADRGLTRFGRKTHRTARRIPTGKCRLRKFVR
jgi:hypothetical protein